MQFPFRRKAAVAETKVDPQQKSRRTFFKMLGLGAAGLSTAKMYAGKNNMGDRLIKAAHFAADSVKLTIYRPQDLMELQLTFVGFKRSGNSLSRSGSPNLLIVYFPAQHIAEQAFPETGIFDDAAVNALNSSKTKGSDKETKPSSTAFNPPAKTYLSGKSRLVFEIPSGISSIALTAKDLLSWERFKLVTNKRAAAPCVVPVFDARDNLPAYHVSMTDANGIGEKRQTPVIQTGQPVTVTSNNKIIPVRIGRDNMQAVKSDTIPRRTGVNEPVNVNIGGRSVRIQNGKDTVRQVQTNQQMRGATKEEAKKIETQILPVQVTQKKDDGGISMLANLLYGKTPRPVDESETAIEMPYRLFISPNEYAAWHHEHELKLRDDLKDNLVKTFELWHSQLTVKNNVGLKDCTDATKSIRSIRALWATDMDGDWDKKPLRNTNDGGPANRPFITALYNDDRHCIVHESSNWNISNFTPVPAQVNNLMLSSLGGWLDAEMLVKRTDLAKANVLSSLNLLKWKHIATLGRDHYVEVVYAGYILPFGHEASLVRVTERKPRNNYAANFQRFFVVINEEEKKYNPLNPKTGHFKSFNFSTIKFVTTITPNLSAFSKFAPIDDSTADQQFVPKVDGTPFYFKIKAFDLDGGEQGFEMPLVFVSTNVMNTADGGINLSNLGKLTIEYKSGKQIPNNIPLRNQKMSISRSKTKGDTTFEVSSVTFGIHYTADEEPGFLPDIVDMDVHISAVQNITGKNEPQKITLVDDRNDGAVFAQLTKSMGVDFTNNGNKTGGSLSPNFSVKCLSKLHGAMGLEANAAKVLAFDPTKFFDDSAKLFGVIPLGKIIKAVNKATAIADDPSGAMTTAIPALKNIETPDALITQYIWNAASLQEQSFGFIKFLPHSGAAGKLKVETNLYRYRDAAKQSLLEVNSYIDDFSIEIGGLASVNFNRVGFKTGSNAKVDVSVDMGSPALKFLGLLTFVNTLQKYIPADGFSDPPFLDVSTEGISTGYTLALPDIQLGAFTLRHLTLGATLNLPFTGAPVSMRFNFCEREQPFTLTVSALGGGGFFAVEFDFSGLKTLEVALEFGAAASINLGVASGAVSIMGGIYFKMSGGDYELQGYVRINGAVSVLGLITASIEFLLTLTADTTGDKVKRLWGEATLKIKIHLFMFSKTVKLKTSREFAGAGADPTFAMMISDNDWANYCGAFAIPEVHPVPPGGRAQVK